MDTPSPQQPHRSFKMPPSQSTQTTQPPTPEDDPYEAAARSTADYANFMPPKKHHSPALKIIGIIILILVIAGALGGGVYWFLKNHKAAPKSSTTNQQAKAPTTQQTQTTPTKQYSSTNFGLSFNYPETWKVTEATDGSSLTARSPIMQLKAANEQSVNGEMVFTIRKKGQSLNEFTSGSAIAARTSEKINYSKPSSTQRGSTYLSFLQYASTKTAGIDGLYITGDYGYQAAQNVPKTDIANIDPLIDLTFVKCASSTQCSSDAAAATVVASSWDDASFANPIRTMFESLTIQ